MNIDITRAQAIPIIKAAYDAGTLPAQNGMTGTYFRETTDGKVVRCAIGALFTPEEACKLEGNGPEVGAYPMARTLINEGTLVVDDPEWFIIVQGAHDDWADEALTNPATPLQQKFLDLLQ